MPAKSVNGAAKSAFNQLAEDYDHSFSHTMLGQYYRERVQQQMLAVWPTDKDILEINAGTGEDAMFLAAQGNRVLATDLSAQMVAQIEQKAIAGQQGQRICCQQLAIEQLNSLQGQHFDGILSNFGGLNCVDDIDRFINDADALLKPGGILILTLMGRWVPWEWAYFACHGQFGKASRRLSGKAQWRQQTIYYPRMSSLKRQLKRRFWPLHHEGLGILMPPSYVNDTVKRYPRLFQALGAVEKQLADWPGLAHLADHYLLVYQKKQKKAAK